MSDQDKEKQMTSVTTTTTEGAAEETETSLETLTAREERVIRMLHGMSEEDSRTLQFGLGASRDSEMKLALIEQRLADYMTSDDPETADEDRPTPAELLSAWLDEE